MPHYRRFAAIIILTVAAIVILPLAVCLMMLVLGFIFTFIPVLIVTVLVGVVFSAIVGGIDPSMVAWATKNSEDSGDLTEVTCGSSARPETTTT